MADDGGWLREAGVSPAEPRDAARERFQAVLSEFGQRLASPDPMRREAAVEMVRRMDVLARRMTGAHDLALGRAADLEAALSALAARLDTETAAHAARAAHLEKRLGEVQAELALVRASKRPLVDGRAVRVILAASGLCAALIGATVGGLALTRHPAPPEPTPAPEPKATSDDDDDVLAPAPPVTVEPNVEAAAPTPVTIPAPPPVARETYAAVAKALAQGDAAALPRLTGLAKAGDPKAQLQLATLYENGAAGLARDLAASRTWTRRAAEGGERTAMYNLGLFLLNGDGGPRNLELAAIWFRRAADRGIVDAQYNLGLMYDLGRGVKHNEREALRWFTAAASAGDRAARQKLDERTQRQKTEAAPAAPEAPVVAATVPMDAPIELASDPASVAETQTYLARLGYYIGPIDGVTSPTLKAAANAYMRDRPMAGRGDR